MPRAVSGLVAPHIRSGIIPSSLPYSIGSPLHGILILMLAIDLTHLMEMLCDRFFL